MIIFLLFMSGVFLMSVFCHISSSIPSNLLECYQATNTDSFARPPLTIQTLIELLRKLEFDEENTLNMRVLSNALLHSIRLDGIKRSEGIMETAFVIPYRASGIQLYKYKLLVKYLTPNEPFLVPMEALNVSEKCLLHQLISSTTDDRIRQDRISTCHQTIPRESIPEVSACPIENGVVYTKWGTVSPGIIIAAVASALESSDFGFQQIISSISNNLNKTNQNVAYSNLAQSRNISNLWTSTVAGDLAEVVILQAVSDPIMDITGNWNDTYLPHLFFLNHSNNDFTRSELLGGVDGLILANEIRTWTSILSRTRLSQLLDMYYSPQGIAYNTSYKACERKKLVRERFNREETLKEQVSSVAKLLQEMGLSNQFLFEDVIDSFSSQVVDTFLASYEKALDQYEFCGVSKNYSSSLEVITIFDETWEDYELRRFIAFLVEELDVSYYGSQLGVIHGQNGTWIANVSKSSIELFSAFNNGLLTPSSTLSLHRCLQTITNYLQNRTFSDCNSVMRKPEGMVVVIMATHYLLTDNDFRRSLLSLRTIKASHPEVKMVYVTSNQNAASYETLANSYSGDIVIKTTVNDIETIVTAVSENLQDVPGHIVDFYCNKSHVAMEDYITPNKNTVYEIRHEFIKRANFFVKFKGNSYGDFSVCAYDSIVGNKTCKKVEDNREVNFTVGEYCQSADCNIRFSISETESRMKCAELDCRYPNQIRINILTSWTSSSGSLTISTLVIAFIFILFALE